MAMVKATEILFHGRGGQGAVTAAELLCDIAFEEGFDDVLSIPIIGAERRGAPIRVLARILEKGEIKTYSVPDSGDITLIFDDSLLLIQRVADSIKSGTIIINTHKKLDFPFPEGVEVWTVDATGISVEIGLVVSGTPILNVPMLGAYAKATGHIKVETIEKVIKGRFGAKAELNMKTARKSFEDTRRME